MSLAQHTASRPMWASPLIPRSCSSGATLLAAERCRSTRLAWGIPPITPSFNLLFLLIFSYPFNFGHRLWICLATVILATLCRILQRVEARDIHRCLVILEYGRMLSSQLVACIQVAREHIGPVLLKQKGINGALCARNGFLAGIERTDTAYTVIRKLPAVRTFHKKTGHKFPPG